MYAFGWVRFVVASLLLSSYGLAEFVARVGAWRRRPPRVRRPLWSHLLGFASMVLFYGLIGSDGRSVLNGHGNSIGVVLAVIAVVLRFSLGAGASRDPDLIARSVLFAALPLVVGSPRSVLALTLPQWLIAAVESAQRQGARATATGASRGA